MMDIDYKFDSLFPSALKDESINEDEFFPWFL
jgi:hypothetical protein